MEIFSGYCWETKTKYRVVKREGKLVAEKWIPATPAAFGDWDTLKTDIFTRGYEGPCTIFDDDIEIELDFS